MGQTSPSFHAWYGTLQASLHVLDVIGRELEAETGLPLPWLEVLGYLKSPGHDGRRRMSELADTILLSRGGMTRLVARIEEAGLVRRETPPDDRRATYAVLTDKGREAAERAWPVLQGLIEKHFGGALEPGEAEQLVAVSMRVLDRVGKSCPWLLTDVPEQPVTQ
jgi:DNA-binding MarR family transcriptional regulator